ncbi:ankyrin repeat domain-containing protein SOWAHC-like [Scomber scombrus]|uniref:ankyrin repeat domain-containing protein SOWAHC-like n=1 Tax=Scomber scombrus TaxID=13677 RepID=UPI002DDA0D92|nr:ankyrin repeat domain-containing protein SOWAHC-like [Scomber scombrus]
MAAECSQDALLDFLKENGDRVKNTDLIEHFKAVFPEEPEKKAAVRQRFKSYVDNIAYVKTESGVKYVCLKKKFRGSVRKKEEAKGTEPKHLHILHDEKVTHRYVPGSQPADSGQVGADSGQVGADSGQVGAGSAEEEPAPQCEVQQHTPPGSGYGSDSQVKVPHGFRPVTTFPDKKDDRSKCHEFVCIVEPVDSSSGEMGNRESTRREKRDSKKERGRNAPDIPEIAVIEASPLPAEGSMFTLPGPAKTGITGQVHGSRAGLNPTDIQAETESKSQEDQKEPDQVLMVTRRRNSRGSQRRFVSGDREDEGQLDAYSLSSSDGDNTPKDSRKHFIQVMMNSSPQLRRSLVFRNSIHLSSRSDSDSASLVSCNLDDERTSVALDPLEHEWMMCASDGEWGSLFRLLTTEPSLVLRKDFVTGFTCLHWAAKHGRPELIALIINFAKQHNIPISVDVRSNTGYTPLHIAAMHNHMEVVKLLVGAYSADVEIRDYSGKKACQYLTDNVSVDIRDIIGAYEHSDAEDSDRRDGGRWRFSKVLQPIWPLNPDEGDSVDGEAEPKEKLLRRKSSFSRMKPKLQKLRMRTSQIVHSTSFRGSEEREGSTRGSFKSRPKTHFFG